MKFNLPNTLIHSKIQSINLVYIRSNVYKINKNRQALHMLSVKLPFLVQTSFVPTNILFRIHPKINIQSHIRYNNIRYNKLRSHILPIIGIEHARTRIFVIELSAKYNFSSFTNKIVHSQRNA